MRFDLRNDLFRTGSEEVLSTPDSPFRGESVQRKRSLTPVATGRGHMHHNLTSIFIDQFDRKPFAGLNPNSHPGQCSDEGWVDLPDDSVAKCTGQPIEAAT